MTAHKRLNILHLIYDHPDNPWCGGGGAVRSWAINHILSQWHDITVYCGAFPDAKEQKKPFKVRFLGKAGNYKESRLKFIIKSRGLSCRPFDLVVEEFSPFSPALIKCGNTPIVTIVHYYLGLNAFRFRPVLGIVSVLSEKILLPGRKSVIFVSEHLKKKFHSHIQSTVIGPGVNLPLDLPPSSEDYILFLGRFDIEIKGLDTLVKAWSMIPENLRVLPLYIAGGGDQNEIRNLINQTGAGDIHLLGHLDHQEAMKTLKKAAFLCAPSRMEGCGIVIYEAFSLGKPVVASKIPSFENIVKNNVTGLLVPSDDPESLKDAIVHLLNHQELRNKMVMEIRRMNRDFSWEAAARKQAQFYKRILLDRSFNSED